MNLKHLKNQKVKDQKVIVRVDYNVPIKAGVVKDSQRIEASIETINYLLKNGAKRIILTSHLGRPKRAETYGQTLKNNQELSLEVILPVLEKLLGRKVLFCQELTEVEAVAAQAEAKQEQPVILLENLRFHEGEKKDDLTFAKQLAKLADLYVNDAFSTSHRAHVSVSRLATLLPAVAGFALAKEVKMLSKLTQEPRRPFVMVIGGAKISDKVSAIANLTDLADTVLVGGGVANNFLKAEGFDVAKSYLQDVPADLAKEGLDFVEFADKLLEESQQEHTLIDNYIPLPKIIYPVDVLVAKTPEAKSAQETNLLRCENQSCYQPDDMFLDIGPRTIKLFSKVIANAKTIFWNGPMGVFENAVFARGTKKIAQAIAESKAESILGGGDTIAAVDQFNLQDKYTYVSTAGGASLDFLAGKQLPGLKNLLASDD